MEHGKATSSQLADAFGLTQAAIRRHLSALEEGGMLSVRVAKAQKARGAGRPSKEYVATGQGRETFTHAYDELAISALEMLRQVGGDEAVEAFFEDRFAHVEERFDQMRKDDATLSDAEALSQALNEVGFMSGLLPAQSGEQLCQHHCPYTAVAERFPQLCSAETEVFSRLLHSHVQRLATIAHGDGVCTTHIPTPLPTPTRKVTR
jgi:predicted ArsR family transcriptional regulator